MTAHKLAIAGYLVGLFIIVSSTIRWYFLYPDFSQFLFAASIGILVCIISYFYNWMRNKDDDLKRIEQRTDAIVDWWMNRHKEAIEDIAKGKRLIE